MKKFFDEHDWLQFFCNLNSPKNLTCLLGKLKTELGQQKNSLALAGLSLSWFAWHAVCAAGARYTKWIASLELPYKEQNNDPYSLYTITQ